MCRLRARLAPRLFERPSPGGVRILVPPNMFYGCRDGQCKELRCYHDNKVFWADCNQNIEADGCEVDLKKPNADHCGQCGNQCESRQQCFSTSDIAPAFALAENGTLYSWGPTGEALGRTSAVSPDLTPAPVVGLPPILQFASTNYHACALARDGRLFCWGRSDNGGLGLGYFRNESFPVEVLFAGAEWPTQIAAAQSHSCARMSDGSINCWSKRNTYGELGLAQTYGVFVPTKAEGLEKKAVSVAVGEDSTCALLEDGSVQCWGANDMGQLAQGTRDTSRHPSPVTVVFP